ncbi:hypothetical protein ASD31_09185 [Rhizobium sp. Root482]|nr:hypothetical protein ASD31_09185 [Rhizobium sp. Root482]
MFKDGSPKPYDGKTIADQSKATTDALANTEALARNGDKSALTNATNALNGVLTQNGNSQANNTLSQIQNNTKLGANPTDAMAAQIANGKAPQAPGQYNQNFQNPALAQAAGNANYTNGAGQTAQGLQNYQNSAIGNIQSMLGYTNPAAQQAQNLGNFQNSAVGQASQYNSFENAASGLQTQQAQQLQNGSNPALDYLKNTASGANIGKNAYLDSMVSNQQDQIANKLKNVTAPGIDSQAAAMGRMGSSAYATQRNNAESTAAEQMSRVATDMYGAQYNQDVQNQMNAAGQYGNFANQDVSNRLNANQALSQTSQAQEQARQSGTGLYGDLQNSQNQQRLAGTQLYGSMAQDQQNSRLNAAGQLGQLNDSQNQQRLAGNQNYANILDSQNSQRLNGMQLYGDLANSQQTQNLNASNSANQQFNANRDYQMQGLNLQNSNYQNNISNLLGLNDQRMNAANSQLNNQNTVNGQKLNAAGMAGDIYKNSNLPNELLAGVGNQKDQRSDLELQSQINAWDRKEQQPIQNIQNMLNMLNGGGYSNTTTPVYSNTAGQVLGGLSSLAGLFALCDATTKVLHRHIGYMPLTNGETLSIYEFSYCDDPDQTIWFGPIAQEVEEKTAAVVEFNGKKHIRIDMMEAA